MAEAPHSSSESETDAPPNALSESEEEDFGGFLGIVRDSWELLKNSLRIRQLFFITFGVLLMCNIKWGPKFLETPTRSKEEIVEANYIIYNCMMITHMLSFIYVIYLQFCIRYPSHFGYESSSRSPRQGLESSSESADIGSSEWETEESGQYDSEHQQSSHAHQQSSHAPITVSRAAERVLEIVVEPEDQSVRPRTRSVRLSLDRAAPTGMIPGRRYIEAEVRMSEGLIRNIDIRPVQGVRTRSQSRRQAESSKPLRRKPHKRS